MIFKTTVIEELLLKTELPLIRIMHGKGTRLWLFNIVRTMNPFRYNRHHSTMLKAYKKLLKPLAAFSDYNGSKYRIKVAYKRGKNRIDGKKTATIDIEGIVAIEKVAVDALIQVSAIKDDSIFYIDQTTQKYIGEAEYEGVYMQVTRLISEEITVWDDKDEKM